MGEFGWAKNVTSLIIAIKEVTFLNCHKYYLSRVLRLVTKTVLRKLLAMTMPKTAPIVLEVKKAGMKNKAATDVPINKCA